VGRTDIELLHRVVVVEHHQGSAQVAAAGRFMYPIINLNQKLTVGTSSEITVGKPFYCFILSDGPHLRKWHIDSRPACFLQYINEAIQLE